MSVPQLVIILKTNETIQTLLFPKSKYTVKTAKAYIKKHKHKIHKSPDVTANFIRIRQRDPGDFVKGTLITVTLPGDIKAVVGTLKKDK